MAALRPRPASLVLSPPHSWRPSRPTTPLRSTYPLPSSPKIASPTLPIFSPGPSRPSLPPASPLACWRPDTPFSLTTFHSPASPSSPFNPFLLPFYASRSSTLFPIAAPLLPASPLSLWDEAVSPTAAIYRPSHTPSPREAVFADIGTQHSATIMPRFLLLQTPSCMPRVGQASCAFRAKRVNCPDMGAEKEARTTVEMAEDANDVLSVSSGETGGT